MKLNPFSCLVLAASLAGCNSVDFIDINPKNLTLKQKNNEIWLQGHAKSHTGVHSTRAHISWSVADPAIARVDEKGRLTPVQSGRTDVIATHGTVTASVPVEVVFAEKLMVEPNPLTLIEGGPSVELKATVLDYRGRELKDRAVSYRSQNKEVVSMGQNAAFPLEPGTAIVEVQVEDLIQKVEVVVEPEKKSGSKK